MSLQVWRPDRAAVLTTTAAAAAALMLAAPQSGLAAGAVFGGSTKAREAIVLRADTKAKKLRSAVIAWEASCDSGLIFSASDELTPVGADPGFSSDPRDLMVSRNAKGRFAGTQLAGRDLGDRSAAISVRLTGTMRAGRASGTLDARVAILDKQTGEARENCRTGLVRWSASRGAGRIYGGRTSQEEPVVVRLDAARKKVSDLLVGWGTSSCDPPETYLRFGEQFSSFPLGAGRFGDAFEQSYDRNDGNGKITYAYDLGGSVTRTAARGRLSVRVTSTDAAGTTTLTCSSGELSWKAASG